MASSRRSGKKDTWAALGLVVSLVATLASLPGLAQRQASLSGTQSSQSTLEVHTPVGGHQATTNNHLSYLLKEEDGTPVVPMALMRVDADLYFLGPSCIWYCLGARTIFGGEDNLVLKRLEPPSLTTPWQEFNDFVYLPSRKALVILDKSGDLFEFSTTRLAWSVFKTNVPTTGAPDPDYISLCSLGNGIALLDPERNQIWHLPDPKSKLATYFREVLPWRLKRGDVNVADGIAIGFRDLTYVLKHDGRITRYDGGQARRAHEVSFPHSRLAGMRPSRLTLSDDHALYVVERENNRVLKIDTVGGGTQCYAFPPDSDLRGMVPSQDGFWIISGERVLYRSPGDAIPPPGKINPRQLEARLKGFIVPIKGQRLPGHAGVYPGARRLYRYGVHEGLDMFGVPMGTPVVAAKRGRVLRADDNFRDMDAPTFNRVMSECRHQHRTSDRNEDLFRGCQVWIDHGNNVITRYAHLSKIRPGLKVNEIVERGALLGFVGVSGTGQNLPGRTPYPHLHFEIRPDGRYLGWGLTPPETIGVYEDVFGSVRK